MTAHTREIEFKFAVDDPQAFRRLLAQLDLTAALLDQGVIQTNHFFDSHDLCLCRNHFAIRLREQGDKNILTIKGEQSSAHHGNSVLSNRVEEQVGLPQHTARALLDGSITPRYVIETYFAERATALLRLITSACGDRTLVHIGQFQNERIHVPPITLDLGDNSTIVEFELDTSTFPDGRVDYELEIEISEHSDAELIEDALIRLLQQAGIEWHSAPSKAKRFFSALARNPA